MVSLIEVSEIAQTAHRMWRLHQIELEKFDRIHDYILGRRGKPSLPTDASAEIKEIAQICVHNVLTLVLDAFVQNLSVVGFRNASADANDAGWEIWQRNQMDARQAEIHSAAVKYGVGYCVAIPGLDGVVLKPRSPRQLIAVYEDPQVDRWPQYALETWIDNSDAEPRRKGMFYDDVFMYELDLGPLSTPPVEGDDQVKRQYLTLHEGSIGDAVRHGGRYKGRPVCPVVRYVNRRDAEDLVEGEIERLITDQRAINEVNFDRMVVARFGAFPQKVITGWTGTPDEVIRMSAARAATFEDEGVKIDSWPAATLDPYNKLIEDKVQHVATRAQVSPAYIVGKLVNLSADALAAAEKNQQRKLAAMQDSHGESHEQLLELAQEMSGGTVDDAAEVVWKDTEARSMAATVDAICKLGQAQAAGYPIEPYLSLIPGFTQQMVQAAEQKARTVRSVQITNALMRSPGVGDGGVSGGAPLPAEPSQPAS